MFDGEGAEVIDLTLELEPRLKRGHHWKARVSCFVGSGTMLVLIGFRLPGEPGLSADPALPQPAVSPTPPPPAVPPPPTSFRRALTLPYPTESPPHLSLKSSPIATGRAPPPLLTVQNRLLTYSGGTTPFNSLHSAAPLTVHPRLELPGPIIPPQPPE